MACVRALRCKTCKALQGDRHKMITPRPTDEVLKAWKVSGQAEATDGCPCEPDGLCEHGHYSWLVSVGWVQPNPKARPKKFRPTKPAAGKGHPAGGKKLGLLKGEHMAKTVKKEKSAGLVAGMFRPGASVALLFQMLADQKPHDQKEVDKLLKSTGLASSMFKARVGLLKRIGKETGKWSLETMEDGRHRMKLRAKIDLTPTPKAKTKPTTEEAEKPASKKKVIAKTKPAPPAAKKNTPVLDDAE